MSFRGSTNSRRKIGTARCLKRGEGGSGWAYFRNILFVGKWLRLYPERGGGLKPGGFKVGFYGISDRNHCEALIAVSPGPSTTEPCICCQQDVAKPREEHLDCLVTVTVTVYTVCT